MKKKEIFILTTLNKSNACQKKKIVFPKNKKLIKKNKIYNKIKKKKKKKLMLMKSNFLKLTNFWKNKLKNWTFNKFLKINKQCKL